ncbi:transcription termination/antitermination NusG family protein [Bradyrhizobium sp. INPA03-11B]|uniref:transcription termination/antitermination protein NusG n=1 Tax=Bradyrhizobium sp. INPA03-11B TaxID=418598 RepID=UPI00338F3B3E
MKPLQDAFSPEVMAELATPVHPHSLEVTDCGAKWYVIAVSTRKAERELSRRRFGIYVPVVIETVISRGRKRERPVPIVAGYAFVFFWETDANLQRLVSTSGVTSVLGWIDDVEIDKLRYKESCQQLDANARLVVKQDILRKVHRKRVGASRRKKHSRAAAAKRRGKAEAVA